jgi:hypothetical protein
MFRIEEKAKQEIGKQQAEVKLFIITAVKISNQT